MPKIRRCLQPSVHENHSCEPCSTSLEMSDCDRNKEFLRPNEKSKHYLDRATDRRKGLAVNPQKTTCAVRSIVAYISVEFNVFAK